MSPEIEKIRSFRDVCYRRYRAELGRNCVGDVGNAFTRKLARRRFPTDRDSRICDVGCGAGVLLRVLEGLGYRKLEGVDRSSFQVQQRVSKSVQAGDALAFLEAKDAGSLDVVVAFDVIEHLSKTELLAWAGQVARVLAPNGRWIVHTANAGGIFGNRVRYCDLTHEQAFTVHSLQQLASIVNFRTVEIFEDKPVMHGILSSIRRMLWEIGRLPFWALWAAETGEWRNCVLSQNMTAVFYN